MYVTTRVNPIRMIAGQKEPISLEVIVKNQQPEPTLFSVLVRTPFALGCDRVGLMRETKKRGEAAGNSTQSVFFDVYGKQNIQPGEYTVAVRVETHPGRYDKVNATFSSSAVIRVLSRE